MLFRHDQLTHASAHLGGARHTVKRCRAYELTKDRIQQINPQAKVFLYGQDKTARRQRRFGLAQRARRVRRRGKPPKQLNPQTWAIARSDMLILEPEGTSFKASTLLKDNPDIEKCLFVVDRKNLDRQTREEFAHPMTINALN